MCGIAGYIQRKSVADETIERMTAQLAHRGPDGQGIWRGSFGEYNIALGHRRLAIIDLAGGDQPLGNEDGSVQITFNGEIYNYQLLREKLQAQGHRFATHSDTEAIVHHYEQHGPDGLSALDGMFAFAIWDSQKGELLLARDRVGIKPLYYARLPDGGIAFASELLALLQHPDIDRELDPNGLAAFFFLDYAPPPFTLLKWVRKLEPGTYLKWSAQKENAPAPFWRLKSDSLASPTDTTEIVNQLRSKLHAAVDSQLISDVPVGVFLSGGIDSSTVAALAMQHSADRLKTFTICFEDPRFDESSFAREVAARIGSEHIEETFTEQTLLQLFDNAISCLDEPIADSSILPTFALSRLASRHVKVVLGGDGGDELWAGYPTYFAHRVARMYRMIPRAIRSTIINPLVARLPVRDGYQTLEWKAKRFALRWDDDLRTRHLRWMSGIDLPSLHEALPFVSQSVDEPWNPLLQRLTPDSINDILALDFVSYLPGSVLTKVDRASMAHGLEVRPPLLANDLVDFAFSIPGSIKFRHSHAKALFKRAVSDLLPRSIIERPKKGFAIPLANWLRNAMRDRLQDVLCSSPLWDTGLLDRSTFQRWQKAHQEQRADFSRPLYALLVLDHWYRRVPATQFN